MFDSLSRISGFYPNLYSAVPEIKKQSAGCLRTVTKKIRTRNTLPKKEIYEYNKADLLFDNMEPDFFAAHFCTALSKIGNLRAFSYILSISRNPVIQPHCVSVCFPFTEIQAASLASGAL